MCPLLEICSDKCSSDYLKRWELRLLKDLFWLDFGQSGLEKEWRLVTAFHSDAARWTLGSIFKDTSEHEFLLA